MKRDKVVLVDETDRAIGEMDKMEAHIKGELHRAFSIFIFNTKGEMLIHQRAEHKYHSGGLWTNACCSHPQWGDDVMQSALERLEYEMGLTCKLEFLFPFIYKTEVENNLIEHEFDYVFAGTSSSDPQPNPTEVSNFKWISPKELLMDTKINHSLYTYWFRKALPIVLERMTNPKKYQNE